MWRSRQYIDRKNAALTLPDIGVDFAALQGLTLIACGTAHLAASVAKYWFEQLAGVACSLDIASEFRYRNSPMRAGSVAIFISQSGKRRTLWRRCATANRRVFIRLESSMWRSRQYIDRKNAALTLPDIGVDFAASKRLAIRTRYQGSRHTPSCSNQCLATALAARCAVPLGIQCPWRNPRQYQAESGRLFCGQYIANCVTLTHRRVNTRFQVADGNRDRTIQNLRDTTHQW